MLVNLTLLLSVRFDFIQFYIKVLSSLISERSHLIFKFRKADLVGRKVTLRNRKEGFNWFFTIIIEKRALFETFPLMELLLEWPLSYLVERFWNG